MIFVGLVRRVPKQSGRAASDKGHTKGESNAFWEGHHCLRFSHVAGFFTDLGTTLQVYGPRCRQDCCEREPVSEYPHPATKVRCADLRNVGT
jgi:hypothetical protein